MNIIIDNLDDLQCHRRFVMSAATYRLHVSGTLQRSDDDDDDDVQ